MEKSKLTSSHVISIVVVLIGLFIEVFMFLNRLSMDNEAKKVGGVFIPGALFYLGFFIIGPAIMISGFRGFIHAGHAKAQKKTIAVDKEIKLYQKPDLNSMIIEKLIEGDEIKEVGGLKKDADGMTWTQIFMPDGKNGYITEFSRIATLLKAKTITPDVVVFETPDKDQPQIGSLPINSPLEISAGDWESAKLREISRILVRLPDKRFGYVQRSLKVDWL